MKTVVKKLYEAMFLIDSAQAASDWDGVNNAIKTILEKADAEIVSMRKWDERKLPYEIRGQSRGTYILCYFRVDGKKIQDIERDVQLSERIIRVLILSAEAMSQEDIERDTPAMEVEKHEQKAAVETAKPEEPKESLEAKEAKESSDVSASATDKPFESVPVKTEGSDADAEETGEPESAPAEDEQEEKEDSTEASS